MNEIDLTVAGSGSGYGISEYDIAPYGDIFQPNVKTKLNGKYKSMRIVYSNAQIHRNIDLAGWEMEIAAPYRPEIKE